MHYAEESRRSNAQMCREEVSELWREEQLAKLARSVSLDPQLTERGWEPPGKPQNSAHRIKPMSYPLLVPKGSRQDSPTFE